MEIQAIKYIIISPVKNEERYIGQTIRSVISQTIRPQSWHIINDNSLDGTAAIISEFANAHHWIKLHTLENFRPELSSTGGRSGALMNFAREQISEKADYIVKIDTDISFEPNFMENIFVKMENEPAVGLASGHLVQDGKPETIKIRTAVRGATRIYRSECFRSIGAYYTFRGEDEMDTYKAQFLGWKTATFDVYFNHLKPEGIRNKWMQNHFDTGVFKGSIPYHPLFFCATVLKNIKKKPVIVGALVQLSGYIYSSYIKNFRPFERELCEFIANQQSKRMKNILLKPNKK